jgi:hypothetical protein
VDEQADAVAAMAARLNVARTPQAIADAVGEVARTFAGWFGVALGLVDPSESVLNLYWSAPLSDSIRARYLRVPLDIETPQTRSVRLNEAVFVPDGATLQAEFPGPRDLSRGYADAGHPHAHATLPLDGRTQVLHGFRSADHDHPAKVAPGSLGPLQMLMPAEPDRRTRQRGHRRGDGNRPK